MDPDAASPPFVPSAPFDDTGADTILRASDGADFRVYRQILSLASPFFKDLFSIPQPDSEPDVPVIPVDEHSNLLDPLLRMFYPGAELLQPVNGVDELAKLIEASVSKYEIECAVPRLQAALQQHVEADTVAVYAIACQYEWGDLAEEAAKQSLELSLPSLLHTSPTHHLDIPARLYHALLLYHVECAEAASSAGALLPWSRATWSWITCNYCTAHSLAYSAPGLPMRCTPRAWIFDYVDRTNTLLKEAPGTDLSALELLPPTLAKIAMCPGTCKTSGFGDLVTFIREEYIPKINAAIDAVTLNLDY